MGETSSLMVESHKQHSGCDRSLKMVRSEKPWEQLEGLFGDRRALLTRANNKQKADGRHTARKNIYVGQQGRLGEKKEFWRSGAVG